jgi:hypothetical protein
MDEVKVGLMKCLRGITGKEQRLFIMLQRVGTRQSTEEYKNKRKEEKKAHREKKRNYENQR